MKAQPSATVSTAQIHSLSPVSPCVVSVPSGDHARALNANTPWKELLVLWFRFPSAILENPVLPLKSLALGKSLVELLPHPQRLALYVDLIEQGTESLLEAHFPKPRRAVLLGFDPDGRHWYKRDFTSIEDFMDQCPQSLVREFFLSASKDRDSKFKRAVVAQCPFAGVYFFMSDPDPEVRVCLIDRLRFFRAEFRKMLRHNARNANLRQALLTLDQYAETLSKDPDFLVRFENVYADDADPRLRRSLIHSMTEEGRHRLLGSMFLERHLSHRPWGIPRESDLLYRIFAPSVKACLSLIERSKDDEDLLWRLSLHPSEPVFLAALKKLKGLNIGDSARGRQDDYYLNVGGLEKFFARQIKWGAPESWFVGLASMPCLSHQLSQKLWERGGEVREALLANRYPSNFVARKIIPLKTPEELAALAEQSQNPALLDFAARHPRAILRAVAASLPGRVASSLRPQLAVDPSFKVRWAVLKFYLTKKADYRGHRFRKGLELLTRDPDPRIRAAIARDIRHDRETLIRLMNDEDVSVALSTVEAHTDLALEGHYRVLQTDNRVLRRRAASTLLSRRHTDYRRPKRLQRDHFLFDKAFMASGDSLIRAHLARDLATTDEAREQLAQDADLTVRLALFEAMVSTRHSFRMKKAIAAAGGTGQALASSASPWLRGLSVRMGVSGRGVRARTLAGDPHWLVRASVAHAPGLSKALRQSLAQDPDPAVRRIAEAADRGEDIQNLPRLSR